MSDPHLDDQPAALRDDQPAALRDDQPAALRDGQPAALRDGQPAALRDGPAALRAEHDALAARLAVRTSVDLVQRGGVLTFFTVLCFGMSCKFAWDRWGWLPVNKPPPPPGIALWVLLSALLTAVLLWFAVRAYRQARVLRDEEGVLFARLCELRRRLELDT